MPTQRLHAWLDPATAVPGLPRRIRDEGVDLPVRSTIDMVGDGVTATDDEAGDRTVITIPGQTPWTQDVDAALHDLNSVGVVRFGPYTGEPGPDAGIGNEAGTLHILTDNGGSVNIESFGNGRVLLSTDGTRRLVVAQAGNVGIGPSMNPAYTLDVDGTVSSRSGGYRFPDGTTQATAAAAAPVASVFGRIGAIVAQAGDYAVGMITGAVAATRRIIAGAGLLGGGDLSGDVTLSANIPAIQSPWTQEIDAAGNALKNLDHLVFNSALYSYIRNDKLTYFDTGSSGSGDLVFRIGSSLDTAMRIANNANVGIKAADPAYPLDVNGIVNSRTGGYRFPDGSVQTKAMSQSPWVADVDAAGKKLENAYALNLQNRGGSTGNYLYLTGAADTLYIVAQALNATSGTFIKFRTAGPAQDQLDRMTISMNGNVGIGTADPQYKLDVAGDVNTTGSYRKNGVVVMLTAEDIVTALEQDETLRARLKALLQ